MNILIHRGTSEIGGTCIELQSGNGRIVLDVGMPLVTTGGKNFDFSHFQHLPPAELISRGILPNIFGAYDAHSGIDGVIISHPHADHYGLMQYLAKDIPIWLGRATHRIFELNNIFLHQKNDIRIPRYFEKGMSSKIGPFCVTPYWNDHSAFDSYSFLVEAEGKRIFYSGDFRSHGRKAKAYQWFLKNAPSNIDYLLIEGTTIGRTAQKTKTEDDLENEFTRVFRKSTSITYINTSSQNIDRLVTIYRSCLRAEKTLVVDVYTANILETIAEFAHIPAILKGYPNLRVLYPFRMTTSLFKRGYGELANKFAKMKITRNDISKHPSEYVVLVRPSMKNDVEKIHAEGGNFIYSLWSGYKKQTATKEFIDWFSSKGCALHDIHSSGHADVDTLREYADALNPNAIIPIHTFGKSEYKNIFKQKIVDLTDGQKISL